MNPTTKKLFALTLILSFSLVRISYAQEAVADDAASAPAASSSEGSIVDVPLEDLSVVVSEMSTSTEEEAPAPEAPQVATTDIVQDTAPLQDGVDSALLENTSNPEAATSTETETVPVTQEGETPVVTVVADDAASTTPEGAVGDAEEAVTTGEESANEGIVITDTPLLEVIDSEVNADIPDEQIVSTVETEAVDSVATIPLSEVQEPEGPEFEFALTGKSIPTDDAEESKKVTTSLTPTIDNTAGVMQLSGACSDAYFVVLLFKNTDDYKNDPRSYIINKAYPCENGSFTYSIDQLPVGLPDGIYYMLVGEQGEKGPWKPITSLTEITIKKN